MKHLVVLGAGTGGTMVANRMRRRLGAEWAVTIVDPEVEHLYQPGLLFLPFGAHDEAAMLRGRKTTLAGGIDWLPGKVTALEPDAKRVLVTPGDGSGRSMSLPYDYLVLATGADLRFDLTPGLDEGRQRRNVYDFYTLAGAQALRAALADFPGGRLVLNVVEMPIKCPVAPLEFLFLADAFFRKRGIRDKVELVYATPLDGAFTRPIASRLLSGMLADKGIVVEKEFATGSIDAERNVVVSYDERQVPYDLLVSVPTHSGIDAVGAAGLGNELAFVGTDKRTLGVRGQPHIFALGDCTDLPASKAGSVAHFQAEGLEENLLRAIAGEELLPVFDGHANCFVESGDGKAMLIDFNYEVEPLPGRYPLAGLGPFALLKESRINHLGKLAFRSIYWNALLPGRPIPVPRDMSMRGKRRPKDLPVAASIQP